MNGDFGHSRTRLCRRIFDSGEKIIARPKRAILPTFNNKCAACNENYWIVDKA